MESNVFEKGQGCMQDENVNRATGSAAPTKVWQQNEKKRR
jgi:hypothetical protein